VGALKLWCFGVGVCVEYMMTVGKGGRAVTVMASCASGAPCSLLQPSCKPCATCSAVMFHNTKAIAQAPSSVQMQHMRTLCCGRARVLAGWGARRAFDVSHTPAG